MSILTYLGINAVLFCVLEILAPGFGLHAITGLHALFAVIRLAGRVVPHSSMNVMVCACVVVLFLYGAHTLALCVALSFLLEGVAYVVNWTK